MNTVTERDFGTCPGVAVEIEMVRASGLLQLLPAGARTVAYKGFRGEPRNGRWLTLAQRDHNRRLQHVRWNIEAVFSRLKGYAALRHSLSHLLHKHRDVFMAAVAAYNVDVVFP